MNVTAAVVCAAVGHRWRTAADVEGIHPVLRCGRCRAELLVTAEERPIREQPHRLYGHDKITPGDPTLDPRLFVGRLFPRRGRR